MKRPPINLNENQLKIKSLRKPINDSVMSNKINSAKT